MPPSASTAARGTRPNVLLVLVDDMGYGDIGAFGNDAVDTPTLDRLASEGLRLTQHYSASTVCAPARAGLLTGRYPHRAGAIDTLEGRGLDRIALRETTLADLLKAAGYATGCVGKWHSGALDPRYHPNRRGFDEFVGFRGGWSDYWQWRLDYNGTFRKADGRYLTDVLTEEAVGFIERHWEEPFFLHLSYNAPHFPLQAREEDLDRFRGDETLSESVRCIYAMNRRMDHGLGRVLGALARYGLAENTLVVFASDNGPDFHYRPDMQRFNGHFNGSKGTAYEGGIRVPAIVRWPAGLESDRTVDHLLHFTDWLPTIAELCGAASGPLPLDGVDILGPLRGGAAQTPPQRFWQWNRYTPVRECNAAMRDGDWKLLRPIIPAAMYVQPEDGKMDVRLKYEGETIHDIERGPEPPRSIEHVPAPMLFNLSEDPFEQTDLAARHPNRVARMQAGLDTWFEQVEADRRSIDDRW